MPTSKTPNKLPRMSGATGYGLGFFCGFVVAAVGTYITATDHGKDLKKKIVKEFKQHQQALILESVLPDQKTHPESNLIKTSRVVIAKIRQLINPSGQQAKASPKITPQSSSAKKKHYFKKK